MKVCMFHLMPYRDLPADFDKHYKSAYIDPVWFDVADPKKVGQYYNWTLDEFIHAARSGMNGVCTNQHHQNVYGFMANPSLMGSVLARATDGMNVAIVQLGSTLPSTSPPTRIAEEYAMIDCISGGRLVAGFPAGLPTDATISNGVVPVEQRERYREALALVQKAWSAKEVFAWNGKHYQLPMVNLVAAAAAAAASADLDSRLRQRHHGRFRRRPRRQLLSSELLRRAECPQSRRFLLGPGDQARPRCESLSARLFAADRRVGERRSGGRIRAARRVFLP